MESKLELLARHAERLSARSDARQPAGAADARARQQVDDATRTISERLEHVLGMRRERLRGAALHLNSLGPLLTIARGYAVVRRASNGQTVTSVHQVQAGEELDIQVRDGHMRSVIWQLAPEDELNEQAEAE